MYYYLLINSGIYERINRTGNSAATSSFRRASRNEQAGRGASPNTGEAMRVACGFNKWAIGFDRDVSAVTVEFNHFPNEGKIQLHDVTNEELTALGQMFLLLGNSKVGE